MTAQPDTVPDSLAAARRFLETTPRARILGYLDIAKRDVPDAAVDQAVTEINAAMMDRTMAPQEAAIALLYAANPKAKSLTIRDIACNLAAAERIQASVDGETAEVPTNDAPPVDPSISKKPKKAKKGGRLEADLSWVKKIGTNGFRMQVEPRNETAIWAADRLAEIVSGYRKQPHMRADPVYQLGPLPGLDTAVLDGGSDGPLVVLALVQHAKKGCPKNTIHERARREHATGPIPMSAAEMEQHLLDEWYAHAVPEIDVYPIVWAPKLGEIIVSATGKAGTGFLSLLSGVPEWATVKQGRVEIPDLPVTDLVRVGPLGDDDREIQRTLTASSMAADLRLWLLWLCQVRGSGTWWEQTGSDSQDGWRVWVDDEAEISICKSGEQPKKVALKNAAADHGALVAALAEGGVLSKLRVGLERTRIRGGDDKARPKKYFHLTLSGGGKASVGLPCTLAARHGVAEAVLERLHLLRELDGVQARLTSRFEECRLGEWDRVTTRMREWIGTEVVRRWKYDEKTGQGFLFDLRDN